MIYHLDITTSTNDDARDEKYREGDVVWADFQSAGRGQRGHEWHSRKGENLTFSVVLEPTFVAIVEQFSVSEVVALSLVDMLAEYGIEAKIKWTNDIYVGDKKIAGILIEHKLQGPSLARTVVGIGLNVNQMEFSAELPNPISMAQAAGRDFDREKILQDLTRSLMARYAQLREGQGEELQRDYHARLYRRGEEHCYALPDGSRFRGTIRGVEPTGALRIENEHGEQLSFLFKEVEFLIDGR